MQLPHSNVSSKDRSLYANVGKPMEAALEVLVEELPSMNPTLDQRLPTMLPPERASAIDDHPETYFPKFLTLESP